MSLANRKRPSVRNSIEKPTRRKSKVQPSKVRDTNANENFPPKQKSGELRKAPKEAIAAANKNQGEMKGALTLDQMRKYIGEQDDFDVNDLNGMANTFLSKESRTPPSREEMLKLREERRRRAREQKKHLKEIDEIEKREKESEEGEFFKY